MDMKVSSLPSILFMASLVLMLAACSIQMKALTRSGVLAVPASKCGECHVDIYAEWIDSPHTRAFSDAAFTAETLDHQVGVCLPCHAPETIFSPDGRLATRDTKRDEGVNCIACHLKDGRQQGPFVPGPVTPHATKTEPEVYHSAALCGTCHEGAYAAWRASSEKDPGVKTCQQCHMPAVRRKLTQATDVISEGIVALHEEHEVHRHVFSARAALDQPAVDIDVSPAGVEGSGAVVVHVTNLLPHGMPEGDFGFREVRIEAQLLDGAGQVLATDARSLYKDLDTQLAPGQTLEMRLVPDRADAVAGRVRVRLARLLADGSEDYVIADETFSPTGERTPAAP